MGDDASFDPEKSLHDNVKAAVASIRARLKQAEEDIDALQEAEKEYRKLDTTIENLRLADFKREFYEFREIVRTNRAVAEAEAKGAAARTAFIVGAVVSIVGSVVTALIVKLVVG